MGVFGWMFDKYLPVGVEVVFLGQPRKSGILANFDINHEGKVALDVRYVGLEKNKMTGYWFTVNDFSPALDTIDARAYGGLIVCWKNINGESNFMPPELKEKMAEIVTLKKMTDIYKKHILNLVSYVELGKLDEAKKKDIDALMKQLKSARDVTSDKEFVNAKGREPGGLAGSLFSNR